MKYAIHDMNGFTRGQASTEACARKRARKLADETGLDMQICFAERLPLVGKRYRIINVRCRNTQLLAKRWYARNGQAFIGR